MLTKSSISNKAFTAGSATRRIASVKRGRLYLEFPFSKDIIDSIKRLGSDQFSLLQKNTWSLKMSLKAIKITSDFKFEFAPKDEESVRIIAAHLLNKEKNRRARAQICTATHADPVESIEKRMQIPACPYQWVAVHYADLADGKFLLADDMGVGKTVEALMITQHSRWIDKPTLIYTPVPHRFHDDLRTFFGKNAINITKSFLGITPSIKHYTVTDYNLQFLFDAVHKVDSHGKSYIDFEPKPFTKNFNVIVDEAHVLKNRGTQRRMYARKLLHQSDMRILMTGTPVLNGDVQELYDLCELIDPHFMNWFTFQSGFNGAVYSQDGIVFHTAKRKYEHLNRWLFENIMMRREREQIEDQLPPKTHTIVELYNPLKTIKAKTMFELFNEAGRDKAKDRVFLEWIELQLRSAPDLKFGICGYHQSILDGIEAILKRLGIGYARIDGSVNKSERARIEKAFKTDPKCRVALLSTMAACVGLDMQAAHVCILGELYWVPAIIDQLICRFHRKGLKHNLQVIFPVVSQFEVRLARKLLEKMVVNKRLLSKDFNGTSSKDDNALMRELAQEFGLPLGAAPLVGKK